VSLSRLFVHDLVVQRATEGAVDDYGHPTRTFKTIGTTKGLARQLSGREIARVAEAGPVVDQWRILLPPGTTIDEGDRVRFASEATDTTKPYFDVLSVRDPAGRAHHLEVEARKVWP
jgi:head-tail adaptor